MKFKIEIGGVVTVLDAATVERLIEMVADCEYQYRNWAVGKEMYEIKAVEVEQIKIVPMTQAAYDTLKLTAKLNAEKSP